VGQVDQRSAGGGAVVCPAHGGSDQVRRVSAACLDSVSHTVPIIPARWQLPRAARRPVVMTALARRLFPRPLLKSASPALWLAGLLTGLTIALVPTLWLDALARDHPATAGRAAVEAALLAPLVLLTAAVWWLGLTRMRRRARVRRGLAGALPLWRAGWYCGKCDGAFFTAAEHPGAAPADQLLPLEVFQRLVWSTGGYTTWGKPVAALRRT
jgi:hypothetical protein